ncbi:hypothetical protein VNO78_04339 [Psophocarpus tetragonolobus]|uniref:Uncharacterized protein n=1 Tax=Psophocarpus tetragonolobus TaxID=3891 RepID=A0AAN9TFY2_PSOTE
MRQLLFQCGTECSGEEGTAVAWKVKSDPDDDEGFVVRRKEFQAKNALSGELSKLKQGATLMIWALMKESSLRFPSLPQSRRRELKSA